MKILLRPAAVGDGQTLFSAWGAHEPNFARLTARVFSTAADAERYLAIVFASPRSIAFHIVAGDTVVGFLKAVVTEHRAQVGYVVDEAHWGRGIATEALRLALLVLRAMPGIERIWATCALDNPASVRVLEKQGFEREGVLKKWVVYPALGSAAVDNYSFVWEAR